MDSRRGIRSSRCFRPTRRPFTFARQQRSASTHVYTDAFFTIDTFADDQVSREKHVIIARSSDEYTWMTMGFNDHLFTTCTTCGRENRLDEACSRTYLCHHHHGHLRRDRLERERDIRCHFCGSNRSENTHVHLHEHHRLVCLAKFDVDKIHDLFTKLTTTSAITT